MWRMTPLAWSRGFVVLTAWGALALAGCSVGPDYQPSRPAMPAAWASKSAPASRPAPAVPVPAPRTDDLVSWWKAFNDPILTGLIDRAFKANLDLKAAQARIRQARAVRNGAAAGLWPAADATGSFSRGRNAGANAPTTNLYRTGLDAAWELDLFGGVRRGVEAADADLAASIEDSRFVLVTLASEVALAYIDLRVNQQRVVVAKRNLGIQQHSADVTHQKFKGGLIGELDVANADAQVASTASAIPPLQTAARQALYALSVLLARPPGALVEELSPHAPVPASPAAAPLGAPADLLRRRPDIRQAEAAIHAATARIGVATADLFPKISLSGAVGFQSNRFNGWMDWVNRFWSFGPSATWRVFDAGAIQANIEVQRSLQEQSVVAYQQAVLTALQDVENALVAWANERDRSTPLTAAVAANRKALDLSTKLYDVGGQTDYLRVLDAQRGLLSSEDSLVLNAGAVATDMVALYKALGGGWAEEPAPAPARGPASRPAPARTRSAR